MIITPKGALWYLNLSLDQSHFKSSEFDCHCKNDACQKTYIESELLFLLERMRDVCQKPLIITSGYRCEDYQKELGERGFKTATKSQHCLGGAADIKCEGLTGDALELIARSVGFSSVGVAKTWIHVDIRKEFRRWTY